MSKQEKPRRRRGTRGVLWVIALMMGISALLRLGGPVGGHAVAGEVLALAEEAPLRRCPRVLRCPIRTWLSYSQNYASARLG